MDRDDDNDDDVLLWDGSTPRSTPMSADFFTEGGISASNPGLAGFPTAAASSAGRGVRPRRRSGAMEELDLNSQAHDLDFGMTFGELLRSSSPGAIREAEAALVRGGVAPCGGAGVGRGATTTRTRSLDAPAGRAPYRTPRPARSATTAPGVGRQHDHGGARDEGAGPVGGLHGVRGGHGDENAGNEEDDMPLGQDAMRHAEWRKLKNGPPECLADLEVMFQHIAVDGSSSCVPGELIGDEGDRVDAGDNQGGGSPTSMTSSKRGGSTSMSASSPRKRVKSPMVKIMKGILETMQANSAAARQVMLGEVRAESIARAMRLAVESGAVVGSPEHFMASKLFVKAENRDVFFTILTNEDRLNWLKRWCQESNVY